MDYREALVKVREHLGVSDQEAVEAATKLTGWILSMQEDGYKIALVKGNKIEAIRLTAEGPLISG